MELEGVGVTQPNRVDYHLRLKFGKQAYCVIELRRGEAPAEVAKKLRELAAQIEGPEQVAQYPTLTSFETGLSETPIR